MGVIWSTINASKKLRKMNGTGVWVAILVAGFDWFLSLFGLLSTHIQEGGPRDSNVGGHTMK